MVVAAASAFSQCTFRIKERNPLHRTLFSMACLVVTVQAAGVRLPAGSAAMPGDRSTRSIAKPLVGAATTYFLFNTLAIATAIALSTRQPVVEVWNENFLWSAPSYFVGAGAAALGDAGSSTPAGAVARCRCAAAPLVPDLSHLQGLPRPHRGRAAARAARWPTCTWRRSKRWRSRSTRRTRRRSRTSGACSSTRPRVARGAGHDARTRSRASRPRRCCTTSASSRCPSTSSRSPAR